MAQVTAEAVAEMAQSLRVMYCQHWNGAYCDICAAEKICAFALQVAKETRMECARAVCEWCAKPEKYPAAMKDATGDWMHVRSDLEIPCIAAKIHELGGRKP